MTIKKINNLIKVCVNKIQNITKFKIDVYNIYKTIKKNIRPIIIFLKMLIRYLISKYYYKISNIDFVIAAYYDKQVYDFFMTFNKLKEFFTKREPQKKLWVSMVYYYLIMFIGILYYAPITWFLLKVLTDPQNWMLHYLDHMNLSMAL